MTLLFCDPADLNEFANDPVIFKRVALKGQDRLDLAPLRGQAFALKCEKGGFIFHLNSPRVYEVHTLFRPCDGVLDFARDALERAFCQTDCLDVITRVPIFNKSAMRLTESCGFDYLFSTAKTFNGLHGKSDTNHYRINLWDWIVRSEKLREIGANFHKRLDRFDGALQHGDDPIHDKFVGFGVLCAQYGCHIKGAVEYNRWAAFAGYRQVGFNDSGEVFFDNVVIRRDGEIECL